MRSKTLLYIIAGTDRSYTDGYLTEYFASIICGLEIFIIQLFGPSELSVDTRGYNLLQTDPFFHTFCRLASHSTYTHQSGLLLNKDILSDTIPFINTYKRREKALTLAMMGLLKNIFLLHRKSILHLVGQKMKNTSLGFSDANMKTDCPFPSSETSFY